MLKSSCRMAIALALALTMSLAAGGWAAQTTTAGYATWTAADRDDHDAGEVLSTADTALVCSIGARSGSYHAPARACFAAHEEALAARDYDKAMRHASMGCVDYRDVANCRRLAALPINIGNSGTPVPQALAARLKAVASAVCRSRVPFTDIVGRDVSGRECAHLARRFVIARDAKYRNAFSAETRRFFESIYEPARAAGLNRLACAKPAGRDACAVDGKLAAKPSARWHVLSVLELHEMIERREQEAGLGMHATIATLACNEPVSLAYRPLESACDPTDGLRAGLELTPGQ